MSPPRTELIAPPYGGSTHDWIVWIESHAVSQALGLKCSSVDGGSVTVVLENSVFPLNPNGAVHGGLVIACADQCFGLVATTAISAGSVPATTTLTSEFLRPAVPPLTFEARVDRVGRTTAFITVDVLNATGKLATKVSGTMSIDGTSRFLG